MPREPLSRKAKIDTLDEYFNMFQEMLSSRTLPPEWQWKGTLDFVRNNGKLLEPSPLTKEEELFLQDVLYAAREYQRVRECYRNALNVAAMAVMLGGKRFDIKYGEGMAVEDIGLPLEHAVMLLNDKPIDTTWRLGHNPRPVSWTRLMQRVKYNLTHHVYYMVAMPVLECMLWVDKHDSYGIIDMNPAMMKAGLECLTIKS